MKQAVNIFFTQRIAWFCNKILHEEIRVFMLFMFSFFRSNKKLVAGEVFLCNLSVAGVLVSSTALPILVISAFRKAWIFGDICKFLINQTYHVKSLFPVQIPSYLLLKSKLINQVKFEHHTNHHHHKHL